MHLGYTGLVREKKSGICPRVIYMFVVLLKGSIILFVIILTYLLIYLLGSRHVSVGPRRQNVAGRTVVNMGRPWRYHADELQAL